MKGLAAAPPQCSTRIGVSTSMKPRPSRKRRIADDDAAAQEEELAHLRVGDEVAVALAVALLHVREAVPLLRRRLQRLREHRQVLGVDRDLAGLGAKQRAFGAERCRRGRRPSGSRSRPSPSLSSRDETWMRPLPSRRSRKAALPMRRSAVTRPPTFARGASPCGPASQASKAATASALVWLRLYRGGYGSMPRSRRRSSFATRCW